MTATLTDILVTSSLDGSEQPSLFFCPSEEKRIPLVVGLHPWSHDRHYPQAVNSYFELAQKYGWALLLPNFRGPNLHTNPNVRDACGSKLARQDIFDAIEHVCANFPLDRDNIFLLGCSGGGHMSLLAAEEHPELFKGIDVWCPVTDIARWYDYVSMKGYGYKHEIEACLGGTPAEKPEEAAYRSPTSNIGPLARTTVCIRHGRHDDIVPHTHSLDLIKRLNDLAPEHFFFEIFDGGHESNEAHSFEWFANLAKVARSTVEIGH